MFIKYIHKAIFNVMTINHFIKINIIFWVEKIGHLLFSTFSY